jgi:hypothetical protein
MNLSRMTVASDCLFSVAVRAPALLEEQQTVEFS